ncbi:hypothetical protein GCM10010309_02420 [Streptomyces violaceochromogenes]|nr:hypothetical protein GCM10010309_02420 [Streptomyces violaceochromogenes]
MQNIARPSRSPDPPVLLTAPSLLAPEANAQGRTALCVGPFGPIEWRARFRRPVDGAHRPLARA